MAYNPNQKNLLHMSWKFYLIPDYTAEKQELIEYFEIPNEKILIIASKIPNNIEDDEIVLSNLNSINI